MDQIKVEAIEGDSAPLDSVLVKLEPAGSIKEKPQDEPSAVYSTVQPMSGNILGEPLPFAESTELPMSSALNDLGNMNIDKKLEPSWSMKEEPQDKPHSTEQPMSDNTPGTLLSLNRNRVCQCCSATFVLVSSLELHAASAHGENLHFVFPASSTVDWCDADNWSYMGKEGGDRSSRKTEDRPDSMGKGEEKRRRQHGCDMCRKTFARAGHLIVHKRTHTGEKPFACDMCDKAFTVASHLKTHKRTHTGEKPFICGVCSKAFTQAGHLKAHVLIHTGEKPFVCAMCSKAFTRVCDLKTHKLTHTGQKSFVCDVCSKAFTTASHLKRHKIFHAEERPYKCPHCDAGFYQFVDLQRHTMSVHTNDKPYICDICGVAFSQTSNLQRHKKNHKDEKPYVCTDCGKGFTASSTLKRHYLTHTGEKPHTCLHCPAAYTRSSDLKRHAEKCHE